MWGFEPWPVTSPDPKPFTITTKPHKFHVLIWAQNLTKLWGELDFLAPKTIVLKSQVLNEKTATQVFPEMEFFKVVELMDSMELVECVNEI